MGMYYNIVCVPNFSFFVVNNLKFSFPFLKILRRLFDQEVERFIDNINVLSCFEWNTFKKSVFLNSIFHFKVSGKTSNRAQIYKKKIYFLPSKNGLISSSQYFAPLALNPLCCQQVCAIQ